LEWGGSANFFKALREDGTPHPADLGRPALRNDCIKYLEAFRYLSACRIWTEVGPQPVQVSEVKAYLDIIGITDPYTKKKYLTLVRELDGTQMQHLARKHT
jgi:hypothetical protein